MLLSWREIMLQNKKWSSVALVKFLIDAQVTPKLLSIDAITDMARKILPSHSPEEQAFYS